jgi:hypothetical protein
MFNRKSKLDNQNDNNLMTSVDDLHKNGPTSSSSKSKIKGWMKESANSLKNNIKDSKALGKVLEVKDKLIPKLSGTTNNTNAVDTTDASSTKSGPTLSSFVRGSNVNANTSDRSVILDGLSFPLSRSSATGSDKSSNQSHSFINPFSPNGKPCHKPTHSSYYYTPETCSPSPVAIAVTDAPTDTYAYGIYDAQQTVTNPFDICVEPDVGKSVTVFDDLLPHSMYLYMEAEIDPRSESLVTSQKQKLRECVEMDYSKHPGYHEDCVRHVFGDLMNIMKQESFSHALQQAVVEIVEELLYSYLSDNYLSFLSEGMLLVHTTQDGKSVVSPEIVTVEMVGDHKLAEDEINIQLKAINSGDAVKFLSCIDYVLDQAKHHNVALSSRWVEDRDQLLQLYLQYGVRRFMQTSLDRIEKIPKPEDIMEDSKGLWYSLMPQHISQLYYSELGTINQFMSDKYNERIFATCNEVLCVYISTTIQLLKERKEDRTMEVCCVLINNTSRLQGLCKSLNEKYLKMELYIDTGNRLLCELEALVLQAATVLCELEGWSRYLTDIGSAEWEKSKDDGLVQSAMECLHCLLSDAETGLSPRHFVNVLSQCTRLISQLYLESFFTNTMKSCVKNGKTASEKIKQDFNALRDFFCEDVWPTMNDYSDTIAVQLDSLQYLANMMDPEKDPENLKDEIHYIMLHFETGAYAVLHLVGMRQHQDRIETTKWFKAILVANDATRDQSQIMKETNQMRRHRFKMDITKSIHLLKICAPEDSIEQIPFSFDSAELLKELKKSVQKPSATLLQWLTPVTDEEDNAEWV